MGTESSLRRHRSWLIPGAFASVALAVSLLSGTLGAYSASITNDTNTAGSGNLVITETGPGAGGQVTCSSSEGANNAATCSTINKYGGNVAMSPGDKSTVNVTLANTGSVNAKTAALTPGACTNTPTSIDLCAVMQVTISQAGTSIFSGTAASLAGTGPISLTAPPTGASTAYVITTTLPASATNALAGGRISQPLTWTYGA